ncbi:XdhC family protein [Pleurocapsa sp. FMAR1]|uniref:XdhC family protein n=1 Tax=Pleurocapsa sp. FMAR1 TaxID=3040204 RepID=UPI0029C65D83|nr:XdhC family protein [Pleurocapsa sp. FMAR1]
MSDRNFHQQLRSILETEPVVIATIVKVIGSAPREVGAKMAICADGSIIGTIGGGAGEGKVIKQALKVLTTGEKQLVEINLTGTPGKDIQGVCGGKVQVWLETWAGVETIALIDRIMELFQTGQSGKLVTPFTQDTQPYLICEYGRFANRPYIFIETIQPPPCLLIIGGGHVAVSLAEVASFAGFEIAVQDDRPEFVTPQRFPQAGFLFESMGETLNKFATYQQLYIALVTRGLTQDIAALQAILQSSLAFQYIGAIGSHKRIRMIHQTIQQQGISLEELPNFYAPIGLDIGALTPQEIAVSICAELIKVRRGGTGLSLREPARCGSMTR